MIAYPLPASSFTSLGYFYADTSGFLGSFSKDVSDQTLVRADYSGIVSGSISVINASFVIDIGSAPALQISNTMFDGPSCLFVLSEGVTGVSYNITITTTFSNGLVRADTLRVNVPSENVPISLGTTNTINVGNPITGEGAVYINSGPRYFVAGTPPAGPNLLDMWYNDVNKTLSIYTTNGTGLNAWMPINTIPSLVTETLYSEPLTVTGINTLTPLTNTPDGKVFMLIVNNEVFLPVGTPQPFTWAGNNIVWLSTIYNINLGDDVKAIYSYASISSSTVPYPDPTMTWVDLTVSKTITTPGWYVAKTPGITLTLSTAARSGVTKIKVFTPSVTVVDITGATFDMGATSFVLSQPNEQITFSWSVGDGTWVVGG